MLIKNMPTVPHPKAEIYYASDAQLSGGAKVEIGNRGYTEMDM